MIVAALTVSAAVAPKVWYDALICVPPGVADVASPELSTDAPPVFVDCHEADEVTSCLLPSK